MQHRIKLGSKEDHQLLEDASGFAISLGLSKYVPSDKAWVITHLPFSFYPYFISDRTYTKLKEVHYLWQKLYVNIAADRQFVTSLSSKFCQGDIFMERLFSIYLKYHKPGIGVVCTRVDYMGDENPFLVQYNIMAVGLCGLSDRIQQLHTKMSRFNRLDGKYSYPDNKNQQTLCKALIMALDYANLKTGLILMVIHEQYFNYSEQHDFRLEILKLGRACVPIKMEQLIQKMHFDEHTNVASIDGRPIDAFYLRTGYDLRYFKTEKHWEIRQKMERSTAIKLPSVQMILINSKRMQSEIAKPEIVKRYLNEEEAKTIVELSGEIHDFDNKTDSEIQELIRKTKQEDYVLKPNKEGGGNNFFGIKAHQKLKQLYEQKIYLKNYILMKKIQSKTSQNYFIMNHKPVYVEKANSEFSTFGCFVYNKSQMILNETGGILARTKREEVEEGGVCSDQGVLSGVCVVTQ